MQLSPLLKQPLFWLAGVGVLLLLVLSFWHNKRPADATGQSLILSGRARKELERNLTRRAALRRQDSVQATRAQAAATTLYQQGQQHELMASQLRQQTHEKHFSASDTGTQRLQRALTNY